MKKGLILLLCLVFGSAACGKSDSTNGSKKVQEPELIEVVNKAPDRAKVNENISFTALVT